MLLQAEEDALYWLPEKDCSADGRGFLALSFGRRIVKSSVKFYEKLHD
jgi:hypothetical protein